MAIENALLKLHSFYIVFLAFRFKPSFMEQDRVLPIATFDYQRVLQKLTAILVNIPLLLIADQNLFTIPARYTDHIRLLVK